MGVVGAGSQMVSTFATMATAIQTPFNLGATAVTRFNRAARMGLAPIPSLIFAIRGAITGLKGAFAGLTAFIAANPIGSSIYSCHCSCCWPNHVHDHAPQRNFKGR